MEYTWDRRPHLEVIYDADRDGTLERDREQREQTADAMRAAAATQAGVLVGKGLDDVVDALGECFNVSGFDCGEQRNT